MTIDEAINELDYLAFLLKSSKNTLTPAAVKAIYKAKSALYVIKIAIEDGNLPSCLSLKEDE